MFLPGGHMGPPLRRSGEMVRDVGNGLGHSAPAGSRSTRKLPSLQSLPAVRRGGPNANRLRGEQPEREAKENIYPCKLRFIDDFWAPVSPCRS